MKFWNRKNNYQHSCCTPDPCCKPDPCGCPFDVNISCIVNDIENYENLGWRKGERLDVLIEILDNLSEDVENIELGTFDAENIGSGAEFYAGENDTTGVYQFRTITSSDGSITIEQTENTINIELSSEFIENIITQYLNTNICDFIEACSSNLPPTISAINVTDECCNS